jgi:L-fuconolactonase
LRIVIDHGAKPPIASGGIESWRSGIAALAELPQVHCKLSGLLTEAGDRRGDSALRPYVDHLVASFGANRLMWGSDWPVLTLAGSYAAWLDQAWSLAGAEEIFGATAQRFYRWSDRS